MAAIGAIIAVILAVADGACGVAVERRVTGFTVDKGDVPDAVGVSIGLGGLGTWILVLALEGLVSG